MPAEPCAAETQRRYGDVRKQKPVADILTYLLLGAGRGPGAGAVRLDDQHFPHRAEPACSSTRRR